MIRVGCNSPWTVRRPICVDPSRWWSSISERKTLVCFRGGSRSSSEGNFERKKKKNCARLEGRVKCKGDLFSPFSESVGRTRVLCNRTQKVLRKRSSRGIIRFYRAAWLERVLHACIHVKYNEVPAALKFLNRKSLLCRDNEFSVNDRPSFALRRVLIIREQGDLWRKKDQKKLYENAKRTEIRYAHLVYNHVITTSNPRRVSWRAPRRKASV